MTIGFSLKFNHSVKSTVYWVSSIGFNVQPVQIHEGSAYEQHVERNVQTLCVVDQCGCGFY